MYHVLHETNLNAGSTIIVEQVNPATDKNGLPRLSITLAEGPTLWNGQEVINPNPTRIKINEGFKYLELWNYLQKNEEELFAQLEEDKANFYTKVLPNHPELIERFSPTSVYKQGAVILGAIIVLHVRPYSIRNGSRITTVNSYKMFIGGKVDEKAVLAAVAAYNRSAANNKLILDNSPNWKASSDTNMEMLSVNAEEELPETVA